MEKERINLVSDPGKCSGCGACMAVCPKGAITMQEAADGCVYPVIDHDKCIRCGKCLRICDFHRPETLRAPLAAWAAAGRDDVLVKQSASGGVFATLAMRWIAGGGLVAGAVMDADAKGLQVYHLLSDKAEDVRRMQGSKYVQSDAWRCYADVTAALRAGRRVLFSGTPCQVAAIRRITGAPENLTTIDIICHGVPPQGMLRGYAEILSRRFHAQLTGIAFRDKSIQRSFCARIDLQRGKRTSSLYLRSHELSYYKYFLESAIYRENCYQCPYARLERAADLTIGDYWGVGEYHAAQITADNMKHHSDWSCILVNTDKGQRLLTQSAESFDLIPSQAAWVAAQNHQLQHPSRKSDDRESLLKLYHTQGYHGVEAAYVRAAGGKIRYAVRLLRQIRRNRKAHMNNEGRKA